jgi:SAM-dependent methyltransferase
MPIQTLPMILEDQADHSMNTVVDTDVDQKRKENERQFHNQRFGSEHDHRQPLNRWYTALAPCIRTQNELIRRHGRGCRVLEYGCADGRISLAEDRLAHDSASFHGIDISDQAIARAQKNAAAQRLTHCEFLVMDAEQMTFPDGGFDLVFGRGILHHLDLERCLSEIVRVLRPGGKAIFVEPLGHNPVLNRFRAKTPHLRTPDEHPLLRGDLELARQHFEQLECTFFGLGTVLAVPFQNISIGPGLMNVLEQADRLLLRLPLVQLYGWCVLITGTKPL